MTHLVLLTGMIALLVTGCGFTSTSPRRSRGVLSIWRRRSDLLSRRLTRSGLPLGGRVPSRSGPASRHLMACHQWISQFH
jgi:hypothetical protein